jgi:hypothetical protein
LPQSGRVKLGVEEMRQIFILYPPSTARAKKGALGTIGRTVWRKYLESEYSQSGRMGTAARNHAAAGGGAGAGADSKGKQSAGLWQCHGQPKATGPTVEEQEASAASVGTDDLFSRSKTQKNRVMATTM